MTYQQWNSAIARYFFNPEKAEQSVYLYANEEVISQIGLKSGNFSDKLSAWQDFLIAIKLGLPGCQEKTLLRKANYTFEKWKQNPIKIDKVKVDSPLYIAYLVTFVIPLTDAKYNSKRADSYRPKFDKFAEQSNLPCLGSLNETHNWNALWKDLENWTFEVKNTDLGLFEDRNYKNKNWIYVGKPLAQCLLPMQTIKQLSVFFEKVGLTPQELLPKEKLRQLVLEDRPKLLNLGKKKRQLLQVPIDERGQIMLEIIENEYLKWDGNTDIEVVEGVQIVKGWTVCRAFSFLKIEEGWGEDSIEFHYRFFNQNEYPDDLKFGEIAATNQTAGWSNYIQIEFTETLELKDNFNKWTVKLPEKAVRIFVNAAKFNLAHWVETDYLIKGQQCYILTKKERLLEIMAWKNPPEILKPFENLQGLPEEYAVIEVKNPKANHQNATLNLLLKPSINIEFLGGLQLGRRNWLEVSPPKILIEGIKEDQLVYAELKADNRRFSLIKSSSADLPIYELPADLPDATEFYIKVDGQKVRGDQFPHTLINYEEESIFNRNNLNKLDGFGNILKGDETAENGFLQGLYISNFDYSKQKNYAHSFNLAWLYQGEKLSSDLKSISFCNNLLLIYLTKRENSTAKNYYEAFEYLADKIGVQKNAGLKRTSLQMLDYLGFVDYDYATRKVTPLPPTLVPIASKGGRKLILTGGRTPDLINKLIEKAPDYSLEIIIESQAIENENLLLPDRILVYAATTSIQIDRSILEFAKDTRIELKETDYHGNGFFKLPQYGLLTFSGNLDDYENELQSKANFSSDGWICRIFDPSTAKLAFKNAKQAEVDTDFQLVEYKINEYTFLHRLWKNGNVYPVNKNWGRYLILKEMEMQVIFYDNYQELLAVPATVPLPRLLMKAVCLFSGFAPVKRWMQIGEFETYWHLFKNVPSTMVENEFKNKLNQQITITKISI